MSNDDKTNAPGCPGPGDLARTIEAACAEIRAATRLLIDALRRQPAPLDAEPKVRCGDVHEPVIAAMKRTIAALTAERDDAIARAERAERTLCRVNDILPERVAK